MSTIRCSIQNQLLCKKYQNRVWKLKWRETSRINKKIKKHLATHFSSFRYFLLPYSIHILLAIIAAINSVFSQLWFHKSFASTRDSVFSRLSLQDILIHCLPWTLCTFCFLGLCAFVFSFVVFLMEAYAKPLLSFTLQS